MPERADRFLVQAGYFESRAQAQAAIVAGYVFADGKRVLKPSQMVSSESVVDISQEVTPWVSRAGKKLEYALGYFDVSFEGQCVLDVGASTGGFTQVALSSGAKKVFAVDVGHGQLHAKLRQDERVVNLEGLDARRLTSEMIEDQVNVILCDASFIGLKKVLPAALSLSVHGTYLFALIKPQFEVGPERVSKGGIVKCETTRAEVVEDIKGWLASQPGWDVIGVIESPILGKSGNKEFIIAATKEA